MNPDTHTQESFKQLWSSIEEFGCLAPIFVTPDGEILDGFHRAEILEGLEIPREEWPVIIWPKNEMVEERQAIEKYFREMYRRLTE